MGNRCHWQGEDIHGTIADVAVGPGGWPVYLIVWDDGAPSWWGRKIAASSTALRVLEVRA